MRPIIEIANSLGIKETDLVLYGSFKAKLSLSLLDKYGSQKRAKYILVSAVTPTKFGEGKTTLTIGLSMAFNRFGKKSICCIRQPSLGPFLGIKGGGTGGGKCRVIPEEDINLHFTGDNYAVSTAHNFLASVIDNHLFRGNALRFDLLELNWPRAIDVSDAALREVIVGINWDKRSKYFPHKSQFCITAASELMSILALSYDEDDFKRRLNNIVVGFADTGKPIRVVDLSASGALYLLMKDALMPNLVQTTEGTPCFIHTGPFANISIGTSSIIADRIALGLVDYVVTESGFGVDCGAEKFFDIKSYYSGVFPELMVIVVTLRAIEEYGKENLAVHIENAKKFGVPVVVAVNAMRGEREQDLLEVCKMAKGFGANSSQISYLYDKGSVGGELLCKEIEELLDKTNQSNPKALYSAELDIYEKIDILAQEIYRAKMVEFEPLAREKVEALIEKGYGKLPICVAKTQYSLSHSKDLGAVPPAGYTFRISDVFLSAGAGFVVLLAGNITTLPGLPSKPRALDF